MTDEDEQLRSISRRPAKSGRVSYGDTVLLHESSRSRIVFVPFFIPHTDHTELAAKIVTYSKEPPPFEWVVVDDKSLSLPEPATRRLLAGLRSHLAVAEENSDGNFILIRVSEGTAQLGAHDPAKVASALTKVLSQEEILCHLQNAELTTELTAAFRGAIRLSEMRAAVIELRTALDEGDATESTYQSWCERHSWAFGNAYVVRDEMCEISPGDHLDLLLPNVIAGYRDLVELKRPSMDVLRWDENHRNYYFSSEVSRAIGQCHRYLDVLHEEAAKGLRDHPEIVAYHPRATVVIGRSKGWPEDKLRALHGLNRRLSGLNIMTYDHLLAQGERLIDLLSAPQKDELAQSSSIERDEDIPF
jgi:hypothetical protein